MNHTKASVLIERVDENDRVIGTVRRSRALVDPINFRVAHLFLFDTAGHLLLQKIAEGNRHSGMWGSSAATYVRAGETYRRAIDRAAQVELGLTLKSLKPNGITTMPDGAGRKFISLFSARLPRHRSLKLNVDDTEGVEFVRLQDIAAQVAAGVRICTPTFLHVLRFYQQLGV